MTDTVDETHADPPRTAREGRPAARTRAEVRRGWWPGWIWALPIAALLLVGWWLFRTFTTSGEDITITFDDVHGLKAQDANVEYRGMKVGKVKAVELAEDGKSVSVKANISDSAEKLLTSGTKFWLRGANPSLSNLSALSSILAGPTVVMEPGPGPKETHFVGLSHKPIIAGRQDKPQTYGLSLDGAVGGLKQGEPVKLRGFTVGEISDVGFRFDPKTGEIQTPVTIDLYPSLFHVETTPGTDDDAALRAAVDRLVHQGLQARLDRDPPLVGDPEVTLEVVPGQSGASPAVVAGIPQIPAASGGGLTSMVDRVNKIPIDQIAQNVLDITRHIDALVGSPQIKDAVTQLNAAVTQLHETMSAAGPKITDLVQMLNKTASQLDRTVQAVQSTAKTADDFLGGTPSQHDAQTTLREIAEAARSVRELASYLDQHPEALIKGRENGG